MLLKHFQIIPVICAMGNESSEAGFPGMTESDNDEDVEEKERDFE